MQPRLTLTYYDDDGQLTRVNVASRRFTIGRDIKNDLVIDQSSLSRFHALIEDFDNTFQISDCGSSNGTFVNGNRIQLPVALRDGDVINLAEVCELDVELNNGQVNEPIDEWTNESRPLSPEAMRALDRNLAARSAPRVKSAIAIHRSSIVEQVLDRLDLRIVLPIVILMILVLAAVVVALKNSGPNRNSTDNRVVAVSKATPRVAVNTPEPYSTPAETNSITPARNELDDELDEVEKDTLIVMRAISLRDSNPVLTQANDREIYERIKNYKGSTALRDNFRLIKNGIPQLAAPAKDKGVKMSLLVFAALARVDKDRGGDPVAAARNLIPALAKNQVLLAKDLAQDNLLALAATESGDGMALRDAIASEAKRRNQPVPVIRNVWYLRDIGVLKPSAFDLVMRFLAIGAIAQNPRHYGIDAERLTF